MNYVVCLHVEDSKKDFLEEEEVEEEEGEGWSEGGMCCPVFKCPNGKNHFKNLENYLSLLTYFTGRR